MKIIVSRTGYTGARTGWKSSSGANFAKQALGMMLKRRRCAFDPPRGLAARDSLRMEAGMPLYGHELDETIDPLKRVSPSR